jgi:hypothetical protein
MPQPGVGTLDRHIKFVESRSTIAGSSHTVPISSGSIVAISISSPSCLSRPSNTSTSMSTRAMIASPCSSVLATMRSNSILTLAMSQPVRVSGASSTFSCTALSPMSSTSKSIFQASSMSPGMRTASRPSRRLLIILQNVTPPLLATSRPTSSIQSLHRMCLIRTFLQSLCGFKGHTSGSPDSMDLPLGGCTMLSPLPVNASTSASFSLLSRVQPLMRTSALSKALSLPHLERHASHVAFRRMIRSGSSVWRRQGPWQQVISFATSLSPFFATAPHQILFSFGTHTGLTSVMTCAITFSRATFVSTPLMPMSRIMAFINLPNHFKCLENIVSSLIDTIYPGIYDPLQRLDEYFSEHVILACRNNDVNDLNHHVLHKFPGQEQVFHSADSIVNDGDGELLYPAEYLNSINCSGLPLAHLALKVGSPVMVLRNLNLSGGVCNGSRGILTRIRNRVLEVRLITGDHAGSKIFIPRMQLCPIQGQLPFILSRLQFPVRLCFSMTINKSQGQSVEHVGLDLRNAVFTHGQFYVAVSRVKSV